MSDLDKKITAAFDEARRLRAQFGDSDPRTMAAIIKAVDLADPSFMDKALEACGIKMPKATHCTSDGAALYSTDEIAHAIGQSPQDVARVAGQVLEATGQQPSVDTHRIQ